MRVVQLDLVLGGELGPVVVHFLVASDDVSERGGAEEVLLFKSELFSLLGVVVGVEHRGDVLGGLPLRDGPKVVALVEVLEVELIGGS